ncbi:cytosine permease [Kitasatospora sp. NPDC094015]|uniref:purine-cytosine permease family protein n=1 Tax=Kitasatospora sp. NPDC094015 TaxID=3155205 RepID=UPI00332C952D
MTADRRELSDLGAATRGPQVEQHGIDPIPESERTSTPGEFGWIWSSAQFCFGTVVLGALPVSYGLGWWAACTAILAGVAVGTLMLLPLVRFGLRTGLNDPMASGAHFGVRGRTLGNLITIVVAIGFFAISVWTGGTAVMVAAHQLIGTPVGRGPLALAMPAAAVAVVLVAVLGHNALVRTYKATAVLGGLMLLFLVVVLAPGFDPGYQGGQLALGSQGTTWLLAATASAAAPLSYATFQGDYSRYMSGRRGDRPVLLWAGGSMFLTCAVALLVGAFVTTFFATDPLWLQGLTDAVPGWSVPVIVVFGLVGTLPQGGLCLYAAGLSVNSLFWRTSRATATLVVAVPSILALYLGAVVYDAMDSMSAFVSLVLTAVAPWAAVLIAGYLLHRGRYHPAELAPADAPAGRYWYTRGLNPRAVAAFLVGAVLGVLWVNNPLYVGPLAELTAGVDLSLPVSFGAAALVYTLLCLLRPEQRRTDGAPGALPAGLRPADPPVPAPRSVEPAPGAGPVRPR